MCTENKDDNLRLAYLDYLTAMSNELEIWTIIQIVVAIIMIIVNYFYFKKRSDRFCF